MSGRGRGRGRGAGQQGRVAAGIMDNGNDFADFSGMDAGVQPLSNDILATLLSNAGLVTTQTGAAVPQINVGGLLAGIAQQQQQQQQQQAAGVSQGLASLNMSQQNQAFLLQQLSQSQAQAVTPFQAQTPVRPVRGGPVVQTPQQQQQQQQQQPAYAAFQARASARTPAAASPAARGAVGAQQSTNTNVNASQLATSILQMTAAGSLDETKLRLLLQQGKLTNELFASAMTLIPSARQAGGQQPRQPANNNNNQQQQDPDRRPQRQAAVQAVQASQMQAASPRGGRPPAPARGGMTPRPPPGQPGTPMGMRPNLGRPQIPGGMSGPGTPQPGQRPPIMFNPAVRLPLQPGSIPPPSSLGTPRPPGTPGPVGPVRPPQFAELPNDGKPKPLVTKERIEELVRQIDGGEKLDPEVFEILFEIADDFVENTTRYATKLAKHRSSNTLELKDLAVPLERLYGLRVPGLDAKIAAEAAEPVRRSARNVGKSGTG